MGVAAVLYSAAREDWATPANLYAALNEEFRFTLDPCPLRPPHEAGLPLFGTDGLSISWAGERVYCNPPYGRGTADWLAKAREPACAVYLLPARTDTRWWHDYAMQADEIRFLRGRLHFGAASTGAPFPNILLVYRGDERRMQPRVVSWRVPRPR
jgi:site-specific DNA-methyltransferase (adenine-specific)